LPYIVFPNLGITFENLDRIAFSPFGFGIYWYAVLVTLGIIAGVFFGAYYAPKKTGQDPNLYLDFALFVVPACIIGARIFYVIFAWDETWTFGRIFALRDGGLAIYGVVIAAIVTALVYTKIKKVSFLKFADTGIVGLIIGHAIGRIGNFINREAFGDYYNGLFAMEIRIDQVHNQGTITQAMLDNPVIRSGITYISVHPTFLYEAFINFCLFIFLNLYRKHKKFDGELLAYYFVVYGITRFFLEALRTDQLILADTGLPVAQLISAILVVTGAAILIKGFVAAAKNSKKVKKAS